MSLDPWTTTVLGLVLVTLLRPGIASLFQRYDASALRNKYNPARAGGGAAMLVLGGYLIGGSSHRVGEGYWHLAATALHDAFLRSLPIVWLPAIGWLVLAAGGLWWLCAGIRGYRGPRRPLTVVGSLNEILICAFALAWGVYVPADWSYEALINFALEGLYLSFLIGAAVRLVLVLINPGAPMHPVDPSLARPSTSFLGRMRRY